MWRQLTQWRLAFVLGGPGAGKGVQSAQLSRLFGFQHLSAGELLREEVAKDSEDGRGLKDMMDQGHVVPGHITAKLLKDRMTSYTEMRPRLENHTFLVDGFPRNQDNFEAYIDTFAAMPCRSFTLYFDCDEATMRRRLTHRSKTSGRSDDNQETIEARILSFNEDTVPLIKTLRIASPFYEVDANGSVDSVFTATRQFSTTMLTEQIKSMHRRIVYALVEEAAPNDVQEVCIPDCSMTVHGNEIPPSSMLEELTSHLDLFKGDSSAFCADQGHTIRLSHPSKNDDLCQYEFRFLDGAFKLASVKIQ